jgi:hypothetical protein
MALLRSHLVAPFEQRRGRRAARRIALAALGAALCAGGCQGVLMDNEPSQGAPVLGDVGLALQVAEGILLDAIAYEIVGGDLRLTGTLDVSRSASFSGLIAGIPVGSGYRISLRASGANDPEISCEGSAVFDVARDATTTATVQLRCTVPRKAGHVAVRGNASVCPVADSIAIFPGSVAAGASATVSATVRDLDDAPSQLVYSWTSSSGTFAEPRAAQTSFSCAVPGSVTLTLSVRDPDCEDTLSTTMTCTAMSPPIADAGTSMDDAAPRAQAGLDAAPAPGADSGAGPDAGAPPAAARDAGAAWDASTPTADLGADEDAGPSSPPAPASWPGPDSVLVANGEGMFSGKLGGLTYEARTDGRSGVLWAVQSEPPRLYRLLWDGSRYALPEGHWRTGKTLRYPGGGGAPDAEGITTAAGQGSAVYVAAERDDEVSETRRLSVLRYEVGGSGTELSATHEWNLTPDLRDLEASRGLEALAFIPDELLVHHALHDEHRAAPYDPAVYAHHKGGLFFVGIEGTGQIFGYALDHQAQTFARVLSFASGLPSTAALEFDRETGYLWAQCDAACGNRSARIALDDSGRFGPAHVFQPPSSMAGLDIEGLALASEAECVDGSKTIFWSHASENDPSPIRRGRVPCGRF